MEKNVFIKKNIFDWMIDESQYPIDFVREKFSFVSNIENGNGITINQAQTLANFLKIPFGFIFLSDLPKGGNLYADFRTIGNKQNNNLSKNLKDVLMDMDYKKNWMSSYRKIMGEEEIDCLKSIDLKNDPLLNADYLRKLLSVNIDWFRKTGTKKPLQFLKEKIEKLGFVIMSSGIVGQNTRRQLDVNEFRGFALFDKFAPLIFINSADNDGAECFTLIHELIHLLAFNEDDILSKTDRSIEQSINTIVAEFLMPKSIVASKVNQTILNKDTIHLLASFFRVNDLAIAFRLLTLNYIEQNMFDYFKAKAEEKKGNNQSGGDYYATYKNRISNSFISAVIDSINAKSITFIEGTRLLGISTKNYNQVEMIMEFSR